MLSIIKRHILGAIAFSVALYFLFSEIMNSSHISTDKAYVDGETIEILSPVKGMIEDVKFDINEKVNKGEPIVLFNTTEAILKESSLDYLVKSIDSNIAAMEKRKSLYALQIEGLTERIELASRLHKIAQNNRVRIEKVVGRGSTSESNLDDARVTEYRQALEFSELTFELRRAKEELDVVEDEIRALLAKRKSASLDAERQSVLILEHTLLSPATGFVVKRSSSSGEAVDEYSKIGVIMNAEDVWITAYFKETELSEIEVGKTVSIEIDAYSDLNIKGVIESISPVAGNKHNELPVNFTSGNITRIVQRVPVKVSFDMPSGKFIQPGLSARVSLSD